TSVVFSPNGHLVAAADATDVVVWDLRSGAFRRLRGHLNHVCGLAFCRDGTLLASVSTARQCNVIVKPAGLQREQSIHVWDPLTGTRTEMLDWLPEEVECMAFVDGHSLIAIAGKDGAICLCEVANGQCVKRIAAGGVVSQICAAPDGKSVAAVVTSLEGQFT